MMPVEQSITGCLKPTRVDDLYLLSGIAPPYIRRTVVSEKEKNKQETDPLHPLFQQEPAVKRLKSMKSFLHLVEPLQASPHNRRIALWSAHLQNAPHKLTLDPKESLPSGSSEAWPFWLCLNRLRTATGRCKSLMQRWGYDDGEATCDCGEEQTMEHLLICPLLPDPCTLEDLEALNDQAKACVQHWTGLV